MTKPHYISVCFLGKTNAAGAWKEMCGGEVEGVSETSRKGLKFWEVKFIYPGGAKLALEEMAKRESKYGDENYNPSHRDVDRLPLENVWWRRPACKERRTMEV